MNPNQVLCVLPLTHAARIAKRIDMLQEACFKVEAVAFERDYVGGRLPDCPIQLMGTLSHGRLLLRTLKLLKSVPKVRAAMRRHDMVHAFSPDMALLALVAGLGLGKPVAVEVADIREAQTAKGLKGLVVRVMDKFTVNRCQMLIVTSEHYFRYYRDWLRVSRPGLVLENKLNASFCDEVRAVATPEVPVPALQDRPLRIGWFGRLRDEWSLRVVDALTRLPQSRISFVIAGSLSLSVEDLPQLLNENSGIEFLGPYNHPEDLPSLYNKVDMVLACRPPDVPSCWSRTNRYYDACYFQRPLIVRAGCADADETARHGIGLVIEDESPEGAAAAIRGITTVDLHRWRANVRALPQTVFTNHGDAEKLGLAMTKMADGTLTE